MIHRHDAVELQMLQELCFNGEMWIGLADLQSTLSLDFLQPVL